MPPTWANSKHGEPVLRLLFDVDQVSKILSLSSTAVDRLCQLGELRPSITVGNRRLFSRLDLERFANAESPRQIDLSVAEHVTA